MKTMIFSESGKLSDLTHRIESEGHEAACFITRPSSDLQCQGINNRVKAWRPAIEQADLVLIEGQLPYNAAEKINHHAKVVIGGDLVDLVIDNSDLDEQQEYLLWWGGRGWVLPVFRVMSVTTLLAGNLGPVVGHMGVVITAMDKYQPIKPVMDSVEAHLLQTSYRGPVSFVVGKRKSQWFLQRASFGIDPMPFVGLLELLPASIFTPLFEASCGLLNEFPLRADSAAIVHLSAPVWPSGHGEGCKEFSIEPGARKHVYLNGVGDTPGSHYRNDGSGAVGYAASCGRKIDGTNNFRNAFRRVQRVINSIHLPELQYRNDLQSILTQQYNKNEQHG